MEIKAYGTVAKEVMRDTRLSAAEKGLYAYLCTYAGGSGSCFPSRGLIAYEMQLNKDTVTRYLRKLAELGYITLAKARTGGRFANNRYVIKHQSGGAAFFKPSSTGADRTVSDRTVSEKTGSGISVTKNNNSKIKKNKMNMGKINIHKSCEEKADRRVSNSDSADRVRRYVDTIPNKKLKNSVEKFVELREELGKPFSGTSLKFELDKLYSMSHDEDEQNSIVERSLRNSWLYLYPLKGSDNTSRKRGKRFEVPEELLDGSFLRQPQKKIDLEWFLSHGGFLEGGGLSSEVPETEAVC